MGRAHRLASAVALALAASLAGGCAGQTRFVAGDVPVGPTSRAQTISFSVVLRLRERPLQAFLRNLADPASPGYRHFVSAREFGRRFGPSPQAIGRVEQRLASAGLRVSGRYPQRTALEVDGSIGALSALFRTSFGDFRTPAGVRYRRPLRPPTVPPDLAGTVVALSGLNNRPILHSLDIPHTGLTPQDAETAYDITPLRNIPLAGEGQTVAVFSVGDSVSNEDIAAFDGDAGVTAPPVIHCIEQTVGHVSCGNAAVPESASDYPKCLGCEENALDVDVIRGIAPKAQILNWIVQLDPSVISQRGLGSGLADSIGRAVDEIAKDGRATIISMSYGVCDVPTWLGGTPWLDAGDRMRGENALRSAVGQGINIFVSSGDQGAYECQRGHLDDQRPTVSWPGDSPWVVSVGGTLLSVRRDGTYLDEAGWEDVVENSGTGGGVNPLDARPTWQSAPGVPTNARRQLPDIAAAADPDSGFFVVFAGPRAIGGTSASAPFWAASTALVAAYAAKQHAGRLPQLAPLLYRLASERQPFRPFHDVVRGGNRRDDAGPGWDYATGLGSPDVYNLARDAVKALR